MKLFLPAFIFSGILLSCHTPQKVVTTAPVQSPSLVTHGKLFASVFMQRAAEYHALCLQAYNIARLRLDEILRSSPASKPKAIVTDVDETILDNSANEVHQDLQGKGFDPVQWNSWTAKARADSVPGAPSFLKYAASKNVEVFYITNRDIKDRDGTLKNLRLFGFPNADSNHLLLRQNVSGKELRRQQVMADHDIILYLGDNLSDFSALYDKKSVEERLHTVQQQSGMFGSRFIILPNPVYGDWESSLYQFKPLNEAQKDSAILKSLKNY